MENQLDKCGDTMTITHWNQWRSKRTQALKEPHGWLSLTSLTWLSDIPSPIPHFPGLWSVIFSPENNVFIVNVHADSDTEFFRDGMPVREATFVLSRGESDMSLSYKDQIAEVAQRGEGSLIRIRDPHSALRTSFTGVPVWDFTPTWICPCVPMWDEETSVITVTSAQENLTTSLTRVGTVRVSLPDGSHITLTVTGSVNEPSIIFHDHTNGVDTPLWRVAPLVYCTSEGNISGGQWFINFNCSQVFPSHFTPFGTCPMPPAGNKIPLRVEAGEKSPILS
ncbi:DUF1684 domain-containing protein [Schaalia sp. lx-100]|uniref:DUF1684 domain-containing protein n=1 Tax=Schaalia sp. lx-100 TaxID=2899081 RepID=UPI001E2F8330|nr:DUF1684 domain-containing protein [Schaalia sp. lx-100]